MNRKYRKTVIAGNWKMNKLASEVKPFVEELRGMMPKTKSCETVLCVPYPLIPAASKAIRDSRLAYGAQDVSVHDSGAYTGEVAAPMLADLGVKYCIVGHSERREYHAETDAMVNTKAKNLLAAGITPIICVGESLDQREKGLTMEYVDYQVKAALAGIEALAAFIREIGLPTTFAELGVEPKEELLHAVANSTNIQPGCCKKLTPEEIYAILLECR
jgi:triosephosphate isomerase